MNHGTAKVFCKCENEYQDKRYGKEVRIANATQKGGGNSDDFIEVRCTVCKAIHRVSKSKVK